MANWVRLWEDMPTDPKWRVVAKRAKRPISEVMAVFMFMMTNAGANATERGTLSNWSDEDVAAALDLDPECIEAIRAAMQGKTLDGDHLTGWEKRQPKREDGAAERAKAFRERNRTQPNAQKRPEADTDAEADTDKNSGGGLLTRATAAAAAGQIIETRIETPPVIATPIRDELVRRLNEATGWKLDARNVEHIERLIVGGVSVEDRILPIARTVAAELSRQGKPAPDTWAYLAKPIADPARIATPASREIDLVWIRPDTPEWQSMLAAGKKESFLRGQLRKSPDGLEAMPIARTALPFRATA